MAVERFVSWEVRFSKATSTASLPGAGRPDMSGDRPKVTETALPHAAPAVTASGMDWIIGDAFTGHARKTTMISKRANSSVVAESSLNGARYARLISRAVINIAHGVFGSNRNRRANGFDGGYVRTTGVNIATGQHGDELC
jgi:hypothetical protein